MDTKILTASRLVHILAALFNLLFIYIPVVHNWEYGFAVVQFVSTPLLIITGIALVRIRKRRMASLESCQN